MSVVFVVGFLTMLQIGGKGMTRCVTQVKVTLGSYALHSLFSPVAMLREALPSELTSIL